MSEFSESYHLRTERIEDAIDLLRQAELKGYVYQPVNGWVTFLADESSFQPDERIISAARQPLLHYVCAEDHGWSFELFDHAKVVCSFGCDWNNDIEIDDRNYSRAVLERYVPSAQPGLLDNFDQHMRPKDFDELYESGPAKLFAQAMGLEHYDWLAYDYMANDYSESPEDYPEVTEVT